MLRTTSKKFRANLNAFFMKNARLESYEKAETVDELLNLENVKFNAEFGPRIRKIGPQRAFFEYIEGLGGVVFPNWKLDPCFDTLSSLQEMTPAEKAAAAKKYGENAEKSAENELTYLLFREMERVARKAAAND